MVPPNLPQHIKDLDGQLSGRADDEGPEPVVLGPSCVVQLFENGDEESERLAAAGLGGAEDVVALEGEGDRGSLDIGQDFEVGGAQAGGGGFAEGEVGELVDVGRLGVLAGKSWSFD